MTTVEWETYEGATYGYADSGHEIEISARTPDRAGWQVGSNKRYWSVVDAANNPVASGTADGLRTSKRTAMTALANIQSGDPS